MSSSRKIYNHKQKRTDLLDKISKGYFAFAISFILGLLLLFVLAIVLGYLVHDFSYRGLFLGAILFLVGIGLFLYLSFLNDHEETAKWHKEDYDTWGRGAEGEEHVEALLRQLPGNFLVINSFQTNKKGDIDHIVIAPAGVFLIDTKNTSGVYSADTNALLRNGKKQEKDYLKQVWAQSKYWRGAFKSFFNKGYFVPVYSHLVLLNTQWVDKKAFAMAKKWGTRICVGDYILKNILQYGSKRRLSDEQQREVYEFVQLMNKKEQP